MPELTPAVTDIQLRNRCTRWLSGHRPLRSMRESLTALAAVPEAELALDLYGDGELMQSLEADMAALLGKPAGRFFHKGVAAQLAALRVYAEGRPDALVALHPQSHIAIDEADAYAQVMGLRAAMVGDTDAPITLAQLQALPKRPAVVVIELPLRRGGFCLPQWSELQAISDWCRAQALPLHFDAARLWESAPHYDRSLAEIAALADSVYVSFYKGLGGLAGCVLAGPADFITATKPWQSRLGGNLYTAYPMVLSAVAGLKAHLPRMAAHHERARQLALALKAVPGFEVWPDLPHINSFQLHLPAASPERLREALLAVAQREGFWLGARAAASGRPGCAMVEIVMGDAADGWRDEEVVALLQAASGAATD